VQSRALTTRNEHGPTKAAPNANRQAEHVRERAARGRASLWAPGRVQARGRLGRRKFLVEPNQGRRGESAPSQLGPAGRRHVASSPTARGGGAARTRKKYKRSANKHLEAARCCCCLSAACVGRHFVQTLVRNNTDKFDERSARKVPIKGVRASNRTSAQRALAITNGPDQYGHRFWCVGGCARSLGPRHNSPHRAADRRGRERAPGGVLAAAAARNWHAHLGSP
jgi:hypothetical protein